MGKSSAPPAPDFAAAAQQTAAGNLETARYATQANRPNQITPYGSSVWTQGAPTRTFNQERYDAALKAAQGGVAPGGPSSIMSGGLGGMDGTGPLDMGAMAGRTGAAPAVPDRNDEQFYDYTPSDQWTQNVSLTPQAQGTLDKQLDLSNQYADLALTGLDKARSTLSDPTLDMSQIPARAINPGQTAQDAILARLNPQMQQQEDALRTRLANQGIAVGSDAFNNDFRQFNQKRNDAETQAALYGINLDNQNRASALQEQAYLQDRPLNLINALRTGAQVQNPTFSSFAQQQATPGPNYLGAADQQYGAALDASNAQNAGAAGLTGGLFSLGMGLGGLPVAGGGSLLGNFLKG